MTSRAPAWCLAIVVAALLQLGAAESFDHSTDQALMSPFGSRSRHLFAFMNGSKVWSPLVRINRVQLNFI